MQLQSLSSSSPLPVTPIDPPLRNYSATKHFRDRFRTYKPCLILIRGYRIPDSLVYRYLQSASGGTYISKFDHTYFESVSAGLRPSTHSSPFIQRLVRLLVPTHIVQNTSFLLKKFCLARRRSSSFRPSFIRASSRGCHFNRETNEKYRVMDG